MITVTVSGPPGVGKTLLCYTLRAVLQLMGLNAQISDDYGEARINSGCADQLRKLNPEIRIIDSEG